MLLYPTITAANPGEIEKANQYHEQCREKCATHFENGQADSVRFWAYESLDYLKRNKINDPLLLGKRYNYIAFVEGKLNHRWTSVAFADSAILVLASQDTLTRDMLFPYRSKYKMYQLIGDFSRANVALEMALYCADSLDFQKSEVLNDFGGLQVQFGHLHKAEIYFKALVESEETSDRMRIIGQANLTDLYLELGALDQAQQIWREVERHIENGDIKEKNLPDFLHVKAHLYKYLGDHLRSIKTLRKAISILEKQPFSQREAEKTRCDLVELLLEESPTEASVEGRKAYQFFCTRKGKIQDPYEMVAPHLMAQVFYAQYQIDNQIHLLDSCLQYCQKAQETADILRQHFLYRSSKYQLAKYLKANTALGIDGAHELIVKGNIKKGQALLFYFMEKGKSQVLLDELEEKQRAQLQANGLLNKVYELELKQLEVADSLKQLEFSLQIERLKSQLKNTENNGYRSINFSSPNLEHLIQLSEQSNAVFLEFGEGQNHSYVMVVDDGQVTQHQITVSNDSLRILIEKHLLHVKSSSVSVEDYVPTAYELYDVLLAPLTLEKQDVVIFPSELVSRLPFSSLVKSSSTSQGYKQLDYALNTWNFSYLFSTTFLTDLKTEAKRSFCALFPLNQAEGDLFLHEELIHKITDQLHGTYFQKDSQISLSHITKQHDFIHISSHGIFSKESPIKSFLFMPGSDSSKLSIEQLYSTTMSSSPFVVLNACETGKGEVRSGEGIDNFTRAFFYSGALGVIESSWKINATQTAGIFEGFYYKLSNGADTKRSLRQAQLSYLDDQDTDNHFAHPYYWSGFRHFGTAVTLKKPFLEIPYWLILSLSIAGLTAFFLYYRTKAKSVS